MDKLTEIQTLRCKVFNEGCSHGKLTALIDIQSKLHEIAATSLVNRNESKYENYVIMLSDVDKVITEMLEEL